MPNAKIRAVQGFKFQPFSEKQMKLLNWWAKDSPVKDKYMCIADGSVRSGKTISICLSFLLYVMSHFNHQMVAMAGKSVGSVKRNIIVPLKGMLITLGYEYIEHRSENYLEISKGNVTNYFHIFGLKDVYTKASYS